jgi:hypothetical protein
MPETQDFLASTTFTGVKDGYVFKRAEQGQGYYPAATPEVTHKPDKKVIEQQQFVHEMMSEMEIDRKLENDKSAEMMELMAMMIESANKPKDGSDLDDVETAKAELIKMRTMAAKFPNLFPPEEPARDAEPPTEIEVFAEGTKVEGRHDGGPHWFNATVTTSEGRGGNSVYSLTYEDGDKEDNVARHRVRKPDDKERKILCKGEKIDARHGGEQGKALFPGRITNVHDGAELFDITYDDGDVEKAVKRSMLHGLCVPKPK